MLHVQAIGALYAVTAGESRTRIVAIGPGRSLAVGAGAVWNETRSVTGPLFSGLGVEDLDPFRDCQQWPATARLTEPEWLSWQHGLITAGQHLVQFVPSYARPLGAGLRAVVPLRFPAANGSRSATSRQAFGAVATVLPRARARPGELAELLLHEFQHVKLNALLDLHVLLDALPLLGGYGSPGGTTHGHWEVHCMVRTPTSPSRICANPRARLYGRSTCSTNPGYAG